METNDRTLGTVQRKAHQFFEFNDATRWDKVDNIIYKMGGEVLSYTEDRNKALFLQTLQGLYKHQLDDHIKKCPHEGPCDTENNIKDVLFHVEQEMKDYLGNNMVTYSYTVPDIVTPKHEKFSESEKVDIQQIADDFLGKLERLELGQQIIYDDLSEKFTDYTEYSGMMYKDDWVRLTVSSIYSALIGQGIDEVVASNAVDGLSAEIMRKIG